MKSIELTKGAEVIVDDVDWLHLRLHRWCLAGKYAIRREGPRPGVVVWMHKAILNTNEIVDHIDGNTLNNQKVNLRIADKAKNSMNRDRQSNNTTGFKGVCRSKGKFQAYIKHHGQKINLGTFVTAEEAAFAYDRKAVQIFGEFANVNFPVNKPNH